MMSEREMQKVIDTAIDDFNGSLSNLSNAVGMLVVGRRYGWRVILLTHSPSTIRKYLKILGLKTLRDVLPEVGELANRSNSWRLVEGTTNFWKAVRGQISGIRSTRIDKP